jgi:hypothetical protein
MKWKYFAIGAVTEACDRVKARSGCLLDQLRTFTIALGAGQAALSNADQVP